MADITAWEDPVVDLAFPVLGKHVPVDNSYLAFSSLSRLLGDHVPEGVGVSPIRCGVMGPGHIRLDRTSLLRVRSTMKHVPLMLTPTGQAIELDGHPITLASPFIETPFPGPLLYSRMVTFKNTNTPEKMVEAAHRRLEEMDIPAAVVEVLKTRDGHPRRRRCMVKNFAVKGFAMTISNLTEVQSRRILAAGIGGRRHMGCGIFFAPVGARGREPEVVEDLQSSTAA